MDEFDQSDKDIKVAPTNVNEDVPDVMGANLGGLPAVIPDHRNDEEIASEITAFDDDTIRSSEDHRDVEDQVGSIPGWIGLALSVLSFFMMPIILGGAAIIVGFIARNRGAVWLGNTAIAIGVISIIVRLFFLPFA